MIEEVLKEVKEAEAKADEMIESALRQSADIKAAGDQSCAECTHDAGDIGSDRLASGNSLKASQYCIVVEGYSLHYDVGSEILGISQLDDLEQRIFDNRV